MEVPHIVVQVVDYGDAELALGSWHHLVTGLGRTAFAEQLERAARADRRVCIVAACARSTGASASAGLHRPPYRQDVFTFASMATFTSA